MVIKYHDSLHDFSMGRGTGKSTLGDNLLHQLKAMSEEFLRTISLDAHRAHDALGRDRCLGILVGCSVGTRMLRILWTYWDRLRMVSMADIYFAPSF